MKAGLLLGLLTATVFLGCVHADDGDDVDEKDVLVLTTDNFDSKRGDSDFMLIEFYAPWCGHCKKLKPEYAKAATAMPDEGVSKETCQLAKVDCTAHKDVCDRFGVKGYPTLKWFKKGSDSPTDYEGQRSSQGIVEYVKRYSGPVMTELASKDDVTKFTESSGVVAVAFMGSDDAAKATVTEVAETLRADVSFGIASADLASEFGADSTPAVVAFMTFDDNKPIVYSGDMTKADDMVSFIRTESFPIVAEISPENYKSYMDRNLPLVWCFLEKDNREAEIAEIAKAAAPSKGKFSWVWLDATDYGRHAENLGLSDKYPGVVIDNHITKKKFLYPEDGKFEGDALAEFAKKVLDGEISPFVRSEEIPEDTSGPMTKVVGKNFDDIVMDDSKDVLLEFFAPWCGHCKQLAPKYEKLAEMFKDMPNVLIAQIDGQANDAPLDVQGYPTIFFFPAGSDRSEPMSYDGERTAEALAAFVTKHATTLTDEDKAKLAEAKPEEDDDDEDEESDEKTEL